MYVRTSMFTQCDPRTRPSGHNAVCPHARRPVKNTDAEPSIRMLQCYSVANLQPTLTAFCIYDFPAYQPQSVAGSKMDRHAPYYVILLCTQLDLVSRRCKTQENPLALPVNVRVCGVHTIRRTYPRDTVPAEDD